MTAAAKLRRAREAALRELDFHWGSAYDIAITQDGWIAKRFDARAKGQGLCADSPEALRELIIADYTARPVPRLFSSDLLQS